MVHTGNTRRLLTASLLANTTVGEILALWKVRPNSCRYLSLVIVTVAMFPGILNTSTMLLASLTLNKGVSGGFKSYFCVALVLLLANIPVGEILALWKVRPNSCRYLSLVFPTAAMFPGILNTSAMLLASLTLNKGVSGGFKSCFCVALVSLLANTPVGEILAPWKVRPNSCPQLRLTCSRCFVRSIHLSLEVC